MRRMFAAAPLEPSFSGLTCSLSSTVRFSFPTTEKCTLSDTIVILSSPYSTHISCIQASCLCFLNVCVSSLLRECGHRFVLAHCSAHSHTFRSCKPYFAGSFVHKISWPLVYMLSFCYFVFESGTIMLVENGNSHVYGVLRSIYF